MKSFELLINFLSLNRIVLCWTGQKRLWKKSRQAGKTWKWICPKVVEISAVTPCRR